MQKIYLILILAVLGCTFPITILNPEATQTPEPTPLPTQTPQPTGELGTESNPLILALAPAPHPTQDFISAGDLIATFIEQRTGYHVVVVSPISEIALIDSIQKGNAHLFSLSPYAYAIAKENNLVTALLAKVKDGQAFYGTQIITNREKDFVSYFDEISNGNTVEDASVALKQFQEKKPCWSDELSLSGYVIPLGLMNQAGVQTRSGAFLEGQPSVVRAVYVDDICDFGATFVDARTSPALEQDYPDVLDKVKVIWRVPPIIPYENFSMSSELPIEMRRLIQRVLIDLMLTPEGKAAMQTIYGFDDIQVVEDSAYAEFVSLMYASRLDLFELINN